MSGASVLRICDPVPADRSTALADVTPLNSPKCLRRRVYAHETLHGVGDSFSALFVVRAGFLKTRTFSSSGLMQVIAFPMAGDVIGLDGIADEHYQSEVVALDDSEVFVLPFAQCERWAQHSAYGSKLMARVMALEIVRSQDLMILLSATCAEQKVATFLLDLSSRYAGLGYSRSRFVLRMTRQEIGSYLGLTLETVSRMLSQLQQQGVIQIQGRSIALLDFAALSRAGGTSPDRRRPSVEPILDREGGLTVGKATIFA